jgi:hypothetical protein
MPDGFRISALPIETFASLFALSDGELKGRGMRRVIADSKPGYPCRVSLTDAEPGERVILLPFEYHPVAGPYRASGPIFVRETAAAASPGRNEIPACVRDRILSVRAYDREGGLVRAELTPGSDLPACIERLFVDPDVAYLHLHHAKPGCYSCRVDRA